MVAHPLPDAAPSNWVDRLAPARLRPWLRLARLDRPTGIWLLMLPGWQGIALAAAMRGHWPDGRLLAAFAPGAVLMRAAGCAVNDIVDKDVDARVSRTAARPVASGQISRPAAAVFAGACTLASAAILVFLNTPTLWLALASLPLIGAYPFMKRYTWWPQAWLGLTFNWGVLMGYAAAADGAARAWGPAFLLYAAGIAWTLGYDTIYAVQDLEDDALAGVKSSARRLGRLTPWFVLGAYAACVVLVEASGWAAGLGPLFASAALAVSLNFVWQLRRLESGDPARALSAFRSNIWAGLIVFAALILGHLHVNPGFTAPH
jgi:4-hydroxybenzoate polyprenyltransferase